MTGNSSHRYGIRSYLGIFDLFEVFHTFCSKCAWFEGVIQNRWVKHSTMQSWSFRVSATEWIIHLAGHFHVGGSKFELTSKYWCSCEHEERLRRLEEEGVESPAGLVQVWLKWHCFWDTSLWVGIAKHRPPGSRLSNPCTTWAWTVWVSYMKSSNECFWVCVCIHMLSHKSQIQLVRP